MASKAKRRRANLRKTSVTIQGVPARRGEKMSNGRYRLVTAKTGRVFVATLISTINRGKTRIAIFSVPKS